jgi:hypothetical protein
MSQSTDAPELTARRCACGARYVAPKGERWPGCRRCFPPIEEFLNAEIESAA